MCFCSFCILLHPFCTWLWCIPPLWQCSGENGAVASTRSESSSKVAGSATRSVIDFHFQSAHLICFRQVTGDNLSSAREGILGENLPILWKCQVPILIYFTTKNMTVELKNTNMKLSKREQFISFPSGFLLDQNKLKYQI